MRGPSRWPEVAAAVAMCLLLAFVALAPATPALDTGPPVLLELVSHPAADMQPATVAPIGVEVEAFAPNAFDLTFRVYARYESASSGVGRSIDTSLLLDYDRAWTLARPHPLLC